MKKSNLDLFGFKKDLIEMAVDGTNVGSANHSGDERTCNAGACEGTSPVERDERRGGWRSSEKFTREGEGGAG